MKINIKLIAILTLLLLAINVPIYSQFHKERGQRFNGEFIFGASLASLDFVGDNTYNKLKAGFHLGFLADYSVTSNFFIQSGYIIKKKGGERHFKYNKTEENITTIRDTKFTVDANYMCVPLSIGVRIPLGKTTRFAVTAGGYLGYGFKGYVKQEGTVTIDGSVTSDTRTKLDVFKDDCFNRFDYGVTASASIYFGTFYFFRAELEYGLANVAKQVFLDNSLYDLSKVSKIRTINTSLSLGFRF